MPGPHSKPSTLPTVREEGGPAFQALEPRQQAWLLAYAENGGNKKRAAIDAGYPPEWAADTGSKLSRNPKILAAIREMADRNIRISAVAAIDVMVAIMNDPTHKDRFKAAVEVANRSGLIVTTQHEVKVTHNDDASTVQRIVLLARQLGMDPVKLLGSAGVVGEIIDAEFVEVDRSATAPPEEDWSWTPDDK